MSSMGSKAERRTGRARAQRSKWVVRNDGVNTETGRHRPRQLGTYPSRRAALTAARTAAAEGRTAERGTVGWLVRRYVASRNDVSLKARQQYEWAIPHIEGGLGAIRLDRLDRSDVAYWLDALATAGKLSRRSIQICRNVLRAAWPTRSMRACSAGARRPASPCLARSSNRSAYGRSRRGAMTRSGSSSK